ncbi:MAG: hypothetical protein IPQ13_06385 [Holophagaceae bacterium]|nr:hypothetical protein [Holophagaceae bacterium]
MRPFLAPLALAFVTVLPMAAQTQTRFIKVDVVSKSMIHHHNKGDGPSEIHIRLPLNLAKGILETISDQEISINGSVDSDGGTKKVHKTQKLKLEQLVKLLESAHAGDLLLEVTTDKGDRVKVAVE